MESVDHPHPHGDRSVARLFQRGQPVAADGSGRPEDTDERRDASDDESMAEVDHEPPQGDGANPAFERGRKRQADVSDDVNEDTE